MRGDETDGLDTNKQIQAFSYGGAPMDLVSTMLRRPVFAVLATLLLLGGCSDKAPDSAQTPIPQAATSKVPTASNSPAAEPRSLQVLDVSERERNGKNGIAVTLSVPLASTANLQPYFTLETAEGQKVDGAWVLGDNPTQIWFMNVEPEREYRVRVDGTLATGDAKALGETHESAVTTRALQASVSFASEGSVLPLGYISGLPVNTVNVSAVDVDFFRVREASLAQFIERGRRYGRASWASRYLTEHADLVYTARFDLNPAKNTRTRIDLPLRERPQLQKAGVYLAVMRAPGRYDQPQITWFSLTDIGLHLRRYDNHWQVRANSLTSGAPLADVQLRLLDAKSQELATARTDAQGLAELALHDQAEAVTARLQEQFTMLDIQKGVLDLSEFDLGRRAQLPVELFLYSPRDVYRPGELMTVAGLIRDGDGRALKAPVLAASVRAPDGNIIKEFKWSPQALGYYQFDWALPAGAATGLWQLRVEGALAQPRNFEFHVEEFLPERLTVFLGEGSSRQVVSSASTALKVPIKADYLYGAPASDNRASAFYQTRLWREAVPELRDFQFGHVLDDRFSARADLPDIQLDAQGEGEWRVPATWSNSESPLAVSVTASVYESGGRAVTRAHQYGVWPAETLIGIRPEFSADTNPKANSELRFQLVNATQTGERRGATGLEAVLVAEDRQYFWEYNDHEGWHWSWTEKEYPVATKTVDIAAGATAELDLNVAWGRYRLEVRNPETGRTASLRFFAGNDWYYDWQNAQGSAASRPDIITLALDKASYRAGDTARLEVLPPASGEVLVMVEGDRLLWSARKRVETKGATLEIPIADDWQRHDLYVTAMMIEPVGTTPRITPKRALGLLHLPLARDARKLPVAIIAPEKAEPHNEVTVTLQLPEGGKSRYATLAAVDVGVLNISDFETPDPFAYFFGQRRYRPELKDMYGEVIEYTANAEARERFGGDADLARGGARPQSDVQIVSLFSGPVAFDDKGTAKVPVQLPDFNGRLRLMATVFGEDSFGAEDAELTVAAPIVAEIALPRFLSYGDRAEAVLELQNMTDQAQTLRLAMTATGALAFAEGGKVAHQLQLEPGAKAKWPLTIEAISAFGQGRLQLEVSGEQTATFSRQWQLGVRPAYPAVTKKLAPVLAQGERLRLGADSLGEVVAGSLMGGIQASPTLNLNPQNHLHELQAYPYRCLEQTLSRALPLIALDGDLQERFGLPPLTQAQRLQQVAEALEQVAGFARPGGGFGLWDKRSPEEHWLTVYTADFLLQARDLGLDVPETLLEDTLKRLSTYLESSGALIGSRWSEDPKHYAFATRAYAGYVLSKVNRATLGALRSLYQRDFDQAQSGLSQVHLGLALLAAGDRVSATEALQKAVEREARQAQYLGDYGSPVRDAAQMVYLLLKHGQFETQALERALVLRERLRERNWLSTQERSAALLAGLELGQRESDTWQAEVQLGEAHQRVNQTGPWSHALTAETLAEGVQLTSESAAPLYTEAWLSAYPVSPPAAVDEGIQVARNWYTLDGTPGAPQTLTSGELMLVHIALTSDTRLADALMVNLLPAGLELENQNLSHAIKLDDFKIDGKSLAQLREETPLIHEEFRDDRYLAALELDPHRAAHLFFLVRAVTPGQYQVPPALAEAMYRPQVRGVSATEAGLTVKASR